MPPNAIPDWSGISGLSGEALYGRRFDSCEKVEIHIEPGLPIGGADRFKIFRGMAQEVLDQACGFKAIGKMHQGKLFVSVSSFHGSARARRKSVTTDLACQYIERDWLLVFGKFFQLSAQSLALRGYPLGCCDPRSF